MTRRLPTKMSASLALALAPLAVAVALRCWIGGSAVFPSDDSYITLHSARSWGTGLDSAYPEATAMTGVTSPFHAGILWMFLRVVQPLFALEGVAWLGAFIYLKAAADVIVRGIPRTPERVEAMVVAALAGSTALHLGSGLETVWAMAAVMWVVRLIGTDTPAQSRAVWLGSLLPWIRPELVLWTGGVLAWRLWKAPSQWRKDLLIAGAGCGAYVLFWWALTGGVGPNTLAAKKEFFAYYADPAWLKLMVSAIVIGQAVVHFGVPMLLLPAARFDVRGQIGLPVLCVFILCFTYAGAAGLNHNYFRYLHPFLVPLLVVGATVWTGWFQTIILSASVMTVAIQLQNRWDVFRDAQAVVVDSQEVSAAWLREHTPPGTRVLIHDAGYLSEHTSATLIDLVGLKTPSSIPIHASLTGPSSGDRRGDAVHLIACQAMPEYYVAFSGWETQFSLTYDLMRHGWIPHAVARSMVETDVGPLGFTLYRLQPSAECSTLRALTH